MFGGAIIAPCREAEEGWWEAAAADRRPPAAEAR